MEENVNVEITENSKKSDKNVESIYEMASVVVSAILTVGITRCGRRAYPCRSVP